MPIKLIVGLGNPGDRYVGTRHNVGQQWVEDIAKMHHLSWQDSKPCHGRLVKMDVDGITRYLLCPKTYMNESGQSVGGACRYYKIKPEEVLIVYDELDLPVGTARLKLDGGLGGHNGLKSVVAHLGTHTFNRLRLGIGRPRGPGRDYVLAKPNRAEKEAIEEAGWASHRCLASIWAGEWEKAMRDLHGQSEIKE